MTLLLLMGAVGFSSANAAGDYRSGPTDLATYQSEIQSSLVKISCAGFTTLGIVEKVGTGVSNRIVAPSQSIVECPKIRNGSGFTVTNLISNKIVGGNLLQLGTGTAAEYAWLISSSVATPRFLNDRKGPISGGWLSVASVEPGAETLTWQTSSIQSIDLTTSKIIIANEDLEIPNGGLVFDSRGTFFGVVSSGNPRNSKALTVAGSPLRCKNVNETKINSQVCLSVENKAILRSTLWPDNSIIGRDNSNGSNRVTPTQNSSDDPFGLKRDSN